MKCVNCGGHTGLVNAWEGAGQQELCVVCCNEACKALEEATVVISGPLEFQAATVLAMHRALGSLRPVTRCECCKPTVVEAARELHTQLGLSLGR
jgi:hypothetical protein